MGRGFFPLSASGEKAKNLLSAVSLVQTVIDALWDSVYSGDDGQFDNSASDGASLAKLGIAVDLIMGEVHIEKKKEIEGS